MFISLTARFSFCIGSENQFCISSSHAWNKFTGNVTFLIKSKKVSKPKGNPHSQPNIRNKTNWHFTPQCEDHHRLGVAILTPVFHTPHSLSPFLPTLNWFPEGGIFLPWAVYQGENCVQLRLQSAKTLLYSCHPPPDLQRFKSMSSLNPDVLFIST